MELQWLTVAHKPDYWPLLWQQYDTKQQCVLESCARQRCAHQCNTDKSTNQLTGCRQLLGFAVTEMCTNGLHTSYLTGVQQDWWWHLIMTCPQLVRHRRTSLDDDCLHAQAKSVTFHPCHSSSSSHLQCRYCNWVDRHTEHMVQTKSVCIQYGTWQCCCHAMHAGAPWKLNTNTTHAMSSTCGSHVWSCGAEKLAQLEMHSPSSFQLHDLWVISVTFYDVTSCNQGCCLTFIS